MEKIYNNYMETILKLFKKFQEKQKQKVVIRMSCSVAISAEKRHKQPLIPKLSLSKIIRPGTLNWLLKVN